ncbi:hypothetical protein B0H11DRAFT_1850270 [Mycena galericulata]|nr:hypothetical protein B0H11DRAFT_1850270 [Mycena galericulata]
MLSTSRFADRLNTNYTPSESEVAEIRALLVEPLNALIQLSAEISEREVAIGDLKARFESLMNQVDLHKALMSPVRRIPQEILQEIFIACLPTHNALVDSREAPQILGRICSYWRTVAYSTPELWSSIHIAPMTERFSGYVTQRSRLKFVELVATWLDRSAPLPLSISYSLQATWTSLGSEPEGIGLVNQLYRVCRRIRHLEVSGQMLTSEIQPLLTLDAESLPLLESVKIRSPQGLHPSTLASWSDIKIIHIPHLLRLSLYFEINPVENALPWAHLTELNIVGAYSGLTRNGALQVLRRCPNLERCRLNIITGPSLVIEPAITLSRLTAFILGGIDDFDEFIACLSLPTLRYLYVGKLDRHTRPCLRMPVPTSHPGSLTVDIAFSFQSTLPPILLRFLPLVPAVSQLRVWDPKPAKEGQFRMADLLDDAFLARFTSSSDGAHGILCPALTSLEISKEFAGFSDLRVLDFIRKKAAAGLPMRRVDIRFGFRLAESNILPDLQPFVRRGLRVTLAYPQIPKWQYNSRAGLVVEDGF